MIEHARRYAKRNPQEVITLVWINKLRTVHSAEEAISISSDFHRSGYIIEAQAKDRRFEAMLNHLIDESSEW